MLGDEGLSRWSKFDMGVDARKIPKDVFAKFKESLGKDISFRTARATLYSSFRQQKGETAAELDLRLSKLVDECKFPTDPTNVIPPYIATTIKPQLYPTPSLSTEHAHRGCTTWLTE